MAYKDLLAILESNKAKARKSSLSKKIIHKTIDIDNEERPYSIYNTETSRTYTKELRANDVQKEEKISPSHEQCVKDTTVAGPPFAEPQQIYTHITPNKLITNRQQSDNKVATNRKQTDNKLTTKSEQPVNNSMNENQNWQQSGNLTGNTIGNKVTTNRQQTDNKVTTKTFFSELVGLQRNIIIFMCHECKNTRSRTTEALTLEHMATSLKSSTGAIKTTIQRLEKKGCLVRIDFKNGRGGWSQYELPDNIYHDVLRSESGNKLTTKWQQSDNKVGTQPTTEPATSAPSSSSLNIKTTTTTELSDEWNFDITAYARFGFTTSQLKQLVSLGVISAADVEQSLIEFSYDLDNNALPRILTTKINFLMGLLRAGHAYVSEGFKNEQDALFSEMARRAESKRKKLLEEKFAVWEASLSDEEKKNIENKLPPHLMTLHRALGVNNEEVRKWMFNYYLERKN